MSMLKVTTSFAIGDLEKVRLVAVGVPAEDSDTMAAKY